MANRKLSDRDIDEVVAAMKGLKGRAASNTAMRLAEFLNVSKNTIYAACKGVRPERARRSDHGKRAADVMNHPKLKLAAEQVVKHNLKPSLALRVVDPSEPDAVSPVSIATFNRYCRENGIARAQNQNSIRPYRKWEASAPGEMLQFDITGLKERWLNTDTRRILKIYIDDKNHPNTDRKLVRLWSMVAKDKYARFMFQRFIAVDKPIAADVIGFLLECFRTMGVPLCLYTDNDPVIKNRLMERAASVLDKAFASTGGFKMEQHAPNNARATGLVEQAHRWVEDFNALIGVRYSAPTVDQLEIFSRDLCDEFNMTRNRATGVEPRIRYRDGNGVMRVAPPETLDSAFKAREFERRIKPTVTFEFEGVDYALPHIEPFIEWATHGIKATFLWPPDEKFFLVTARGYDEYEVDRIAAVADVAGEFRALPETKGARNRKALRASAADRRKRLEGDGKGLLVPGFDIHPATDDLAVFPRTEVQPDPSALRELPGADVALGRMVNLWEAIGLLQDEGIFARGSAFADSADRLWIKALFEGRETLEETELRAALSARPAAQPAPVLEMRSA